MTYIPYGRQEITQQDIDAVVDVLKSDFLTQGPKVPEFEEVIKDHCNANYALAVNSATSALHVACLALGVGPGDEVWTTPITFVASSNCVLYCGAKVDFVDIDTKTYNLSVDALEEKLKQRRASGGQLPKAIIPVHLCGQPCNMQSIAKLANEFGFKVIEDASHAIGGKYLNNPIGNCEFSDITIFSFHPVKIVTTAEGGVATTNCAKLAQKMDLLRSHGVTRNTELMTKESEGPWYYQQVELGFNYRMTDIQAALGISQMSRLKEFVANRHKLSKRYDALLAEIPLVTPYQAPGTYSGLHLYVVLLTEERQHLHKKVFLKLREAGIGVNLHYIPVHTQPYYQSLGFKQGDFPIAENYYSRAISIPMFHTMTNEQQDQVVQTLREVLA